MVLLLIGILALMATLGLANQVFPADSWWPTALYVPSILLVLVGQLWLLGALGESTTFEWGAVAMFALFCFAPLAVTAASTWSSEHDFIRWSALVLLVLETAGFVVGLVGPAGSGGPPSPPRPPGSRLPR
jgi:hypothetical protein